MNRLAPVFLAYLAIIELAKSQDRAGETKADPPQITQSVTVVFSPEDFRFRSKGVAPTLVFSKEFIERFEPLSVGDVLKRIPGMSGSADAGEFDLPQLRGIGPQYTQILINGKRIPGSANDRTLFVDRIPAEMVARLELTRSPASDMDAQGIGGTINIVLKDAGSLNGLGVLAGLGHFEQDGTERGRGFLSHGGSVGSMTYSVQGGMVQRYNPKRQVSDILDVEGERIFKDETNILDSDETSFQADMNLALSEKSALQAQFFQLSTDRSETEDASFFSDGEFQEGAYDHGRARQDTWGGSLRYDHGPALGGSFRFGWDFHRLDLDNRLDVGSFEGSERELEELETDLTTDEEHKLQASYTRQFQGGQLKLGIDLGRKNRHARKRFFEVEGDEIEETDTSGVFRIVEERIDPYLQGNWALNAKLDLQLGLRVELTRLDLMDAGLEKKETEWFPSMHFRYRATDRDVLRASMARTTKRQDFETLQPFEMRDQPRDGQTLVGNPELAAELALGLDLGYERHFANQEGVFGINLFYRHIEDVVETVQIGEDLFQPGNFDKGEVYGLELDLGAPLAGLGLPNMSIYSNITLQDSRLPDPLTGETRRFNLQSDHVLNLGWLHYLPGLKASYGLNWLRQGEARELLLAETALIGYGDNLEFLFEKRWANGFSLRLVGRNLLNDKRTEVLREYEGLRTDGEPEQTVFESEASGRSLTLSFRGVFGRAKQ